jgi:hypothetical protein
MNIGARMVLALINRNRNNFKGDSVIIKKTTKTTETKIIFKVLSTHPITQDECVVIQTGYGKHPAGYSFENWEQKKVKDGYFTTWHCWTSAD